MVDILYGALLAGLAAFGVHLWYALWQLVKNSLSARTIQVVDQLVAPVVLTIIHDPEVVTEFQAMVDPTGPGGRWPTEAEIRSLAKRVEFIVKPQLSRLRGFAIQFVETEVTAAVRRFFVRLGGNQASLPVTTQLPPAVGPTIGPNDEAQ